jgi:hypothetical protein
MEIVPDPLHGPITVPALKSRGVLMKTFVAITMSYGTLSVAVGRGKYSATWNSVH